MRTVVVAALVLMAAALMGQGGGAFAAGLDGGLPDVGDSQDQNGMLGGIAGRLNNLDPAVLGGLAQQLGISPEEALRLKQQLNQNGKLSDDQTEELSARLGARHFSDPEISSLGHMLGLTDVQIFELKSRLEGAQGSARKGAVGQKAPTLGGVAEGPSNIEVQFRGLDSPESLPAAPSLDRLSQFGYSLFSSKMSTFAPVDNVPVSNDYLVGPGDELELLLWGRINRKTTLQVKRDGTVLVPEVGPLQVAGLNFAQAKHLIESRLSQITGVQVDVTMGQLRAIQIFVYGEVQHPGAYTISALARISNALMVAGGISKVGSLRTIQLRRGNQVIRVIDLYNMLLHGNTAADERLEPEDVIFVPVIGPVAAVAGDVNRPAIYEFGKNRESLDGLLKLAGGVTAFGYSERVQIERIENHQRMVALDINLDQLRSRRFDVRDGDLLKVYPVLPERKNVVTLVGNVHRPGEYQWREGMRVADLIRAGEGVANHTFFKYALIRRRQEPGNETRYVPVDLGAALSDHLAGPANLALYQRDEVTVYKDDEVRDSPTVRIVGEVRKPGLYELSPGMKVTDLIYEAGGLKDEAYQEMAELARTEVIDGARTRHSYIDLDLRAALSGSDLHDRQLEPNDELFIRRVQGWHLPWVVEVKGQVRLPGPYTIQAGERLASLFKRCGGLQPDAYLQGIVFIRESVRKLQQERLDESRKRVQQDVARVQLTPVVSGDKERNAAALLAMQRVLQDTESQQAQGRIVIHVHSLERLAHSQENLELENRDQITIPKRPSSVNILGQVYTPTAIVYDPALAVQDYLQRAGGPTESADPDHVMVVKVDGSVLTDSGLKESRKARMFPLLPVIGGGLMSARLEPGDTVYVPEKLVFISNLQYAKDITQIISNSAISLGTLGLLATNI